MTNNGFITNLGKYNEGYLVGEWISFPIDEEELQETLDRIGINEEYEEYFFTDYEGDLPLYDMFGEYPNIEEINELCERVEALTAYDTEVLEAILEVHTNDLNEALEIIESGDYAYYSGMDLEDVAYEFVEDCYNLDEFAKRYFDYSAFARDLSFDGYTETENGVLYIC